MKMLLKTCFLAMICCFMINPSSGENDVRQSEKLPDMSTSDNPIVLKGIKNIDSIRYRQEDYIKENYKGYDIRVNSYTMEKDRFIQVILIENEEKDQKCIYFDMTDVYKKLCASNDKKTREQVKKMREWHLPADPNRPPKASDCPLP